MPAESVSDMRVAPEYATAEASARAVRDGLHTARAGVEHALARIAALDPDVNAFARVFADRARAEADELDRDPDRLARLPLAGVPVAVKGDIALKGVATSFGGRTNRYAAPEDAEVVRRLRAAGAIVVGTTVMPEFGQFAWSHSATEGTTHNPWDPRRSPGGSSCGSAVAVATGMVPLALGSDAGGSVRIPAACCGVVGLKPTRGRVSTAPDKEIWVALGGFGPITGTVRDAQLALGVMAGNTAGDRWRWPIDGDRLRFDVAHPPAPSDGDDSPLRIGVIDTPCDPGVSVHPDAARSFTGWVDALSRSGVSITHLPRQRLPGRLAMFAQMDIGIRASLASVDRPELAEPWTRTIGRWGRMARPLEGLALRLGERSARLLDDLLERFDVLLTPTMAVPPPEVDYLTGASVYQAFVRSAPLVTFTRALNVTGHPALSVPAGQTPDGLPIGAQIIAPRGREDLLFEVGCRAEREQPWPMWPSPR